MCLQRHSCHLLLHKHGKPGSEAADDTAQPHSHCTVTSPVHVYKKESRLQIRVVVDMADLHNTSLWPHLCRREVSYAYIRDM